MTIDPKMWTQEELTRHSVDMRQFIDFRQSMLPNGMRIIEAYNSSGLTFSILPDRGMDIWTAHYKGIPLTWISQGSPHPSDFGQGWLQQFNGGLLTTCGLTHVGPPEEDDITGEFRDIHGNYTRLRANQINVESRWYQSASGVDFEVELYGTLHEAVLFGTQLRLIRIYRMSLGQPGIEILSNVQNLGDKPTPLMLLHHFNIGYPLVAEGTQLNVSHQAVYARDAAAKKGVDTWAEYDSATAGYPEQVFFHHPTGENMGGTHIDSYAFVHRDDFGLLLKWDAKNQPYFTQWKNTRQGLYVSGIEPGNCIPEGLNAARRNNRLKMLEPGETQVFSTHLIAMDQPATIEYWKKRIADLQNTGTPVEGCHLEDYAK